MSDSGRRWPWLACALLVLLAVSHVAWVCDDAFISARVVDNFLSGHGLRWNPSERVQAYTHPLWLLAMIGARCLVHDPYWSLLGLSVLCSALTIAVIAWNPPRPDPFLAAVAGMLALSKSFVDFSSSGLENPLTHFLLVLLWRETVRQRSPSLLRASLLVGLAALNRLDLLVLFALPLLALSRRPCGTRSGRWLPLLAGALPLVSWELFSLAYYGALVPNTALAKLGSALPRLELIRHGMASLLQLVKNDPTSLVLLSVGLGLGLWRGKGPVRALCAGAVSYLVYLVWIGGDFMAGRFLSAPVLVAVLSLLELAPVPVPGIQAAVVALALALQASSPTPVWAAPVPEPSTPLTLLATTHCLDGVCDERAFYAPYTNWRRLGHVSLHPPHPWSFLGARLAETPNHSRVSGYIGFRGYFAGPQVFIVDFFGLSDPLLARLPPAPIRVPWKPGHLERCVPLGYLEATRSGPAALADPSVRQYYQRIWLVTRGPLWTAERWRAIWQLNTSAARFNGRYPCRKSQPRDELD